MARRRPRPRRLATPETPVQDTVVPDGDGTDAEETDAEETDAEETGPLRRCAVTRARLPKATMLRFVVAPDGTVVPDLAARLPGRGIWLSARGDVIETACAKGAFAKAARAQVTVPRDLVAALRDSLTRRFREHLGLARRAGQAVAGYQKAREWLDVGRAGLIVQAADGSPDERARFLGRWTERVPVVAPLDAHQLGVVFGRDHAVHVAVAAGRLAESLRNEADRLVGVMSGGRAERTTSERAASAPRTKLSRVAGRNDGNAGGVLPPADEIKAVR
jgi:predicted RNA-binding protein YlxR (DUF448 family)